MEVCNKLSNTINLAPNRVVKVSVFNKIKCDYKLNGAVEE